MASESNRQLKKVTRSWQMLKRFVFIALFDTINFFLFPKEFFYAFWNSMNERRKVFFFPFVELLLSLCRRMMNSPQCLHFSSEFFMLLDSLWIATCRKRASKRAYESERRKKFIHSTHSHNWAAHEWMNRSKKVVSIVKSFVSSSAFLSSHRWACETERKRDTFIIMKMATRNFSPFIITNRLGEGKV